MNADQENTLLEELKRIRSSAWLAALLFLILTFLDEPVTVLGWELRRFRGALHLVAPLPPLPRNFEMAWRGRGPLALPQLGGTLRLEQRKGSGIAAEWLQRGRMTVRVRRGGEVLRLAPGRPRRTVRNLLQESALPPWQRERLPLLYLGDELVAVPGIGVDARFRCIQGNKGLIPVWSPAPF